MKNILLIILAVVLGVGGGFYGHAQQVSRTVIHGLEVAQTPTSLAQQAELIVVGRLTSPKTWTDTSGTDPVVITDWQVQPVEVLKGQAPKKLTVSIAGGDDHGQVAEVDGAPVIHSGQSMLMYLVFESTSQHWIPLSITQGLLMPNGKDDVDGTGKHQSDQELRQAIVKAGSTVAPIQ